MTLWIKPEEYAQVTDLAGRGNRIATYSEDGFVKMEMFKNFEEVTPTPPWLRPDEAREIGNALLALADAAEFAREIGWDK